MKILPEEKRKSNPAIREKKIKFCFTGFKKEKP